MILYRHKKKGVIMRKKVIVVVSIILIATASIIYTQYKNNLIKNNEDVLLREYPVSRGDIITYFNSNAKLELIKDKFEAPYYMYIKDIYIKEGDKVSAEQELFKDSDGDVIKSKVDGVITKIHVAKNSPIYYKDPMIEVGNFAKKNVILSVSQENISSVKVGQKIVVNFKSNPGEEIIGEITEINNIPSDVGGNVEYQVTAVLNETDVNLFDGMTGSAKFIQKELKDVVILSNKAIQSIDGKQQVKIKGEDGTLKTREIETGFSDGRVSEIINGLTDGEIVIVEG